MLRINKSTTEDELIAGCRKGRKSAQQDLFNRLSPKMLGVASRYVKDRSEAEHVMIGGMVKVFEKLDQFKGEGSFEGWVRRIMVNDCLMYIRKNQFMSLETDIDLAKTTPDIKSLEGLMIEEDLLKLIDQMPIGYKTVFNLYAIEGYNHAEIAKRLDISENTSKSQLSRARKFLQGKLAKVEQEIEKHITNG